MERCASHAAKPLPPRPAHASLRRRRLAAAPGSTQHAAAAASARFHPRRGGDTAGAAHPAAAARRPLSAAAMARRPGAPPRCAPPSADGPTAGEGELSDTADVVLSFLIICPLVATFWRGSWVFLDILLPTEPLEAGWISVGMGAALVTVLHALRLPQPAGAQLTPVEALRERAFSYGLAVGGVCTWHGVWELWETYTDQWPLLWSGLLCHVLGLGGLLALRSFRSTLAPPACVALDDDASYGARVPTLRVMLRSRGIKALWD